MKQIERAKKLMDQIAYAHTIRPRTTTELVEICCGIWPWADKYQVESAVLQLRNDGFFD